MNKLLVAILGAAGIAFIGGLSTNNTVQACGDYGVFDRVVEKAAPVKEVNDKIDTNAEHKVPADSKPVLIEEKAAAKPKVQLAILLDTSGSMDGLIDQARTQLWTIVNEFAFMKRAGQEPELEVALYEYGNSSIAADEGYIRQVLAFTMDLDKVSEELFKLTTNGGSEFCGHVIKSAVEGLKWSDVADDYKAIFIAGNEPFTQGSVDFKESCKAAITKDVIVNTIHCGGFQDGIDGKWQEGAQLADGTYLSIDHNAKVVHIASPHDEEILKTGEEINKTYIRYGNAGGEGAARQEEQDKNADGAGQGADVNRALWKSKNQYRNDDWDLIDAIDNETVKLADIKKEDLPEELRKLSDEDLKKHIDAKRAERAELKKKLLELETKRNNHVAEERRKLAEKGEETLDAAVLKAVREQAAKRKFERSS